MFSLVSGFAYLKCSPFPVFHRKLKFWFNTDVSFYRKMNFCSHTIGPTLSTWWIMRVDYDHMHLHQCNFHCKYFITLPFSHLRIFNVLYHWAIIIIYPLPYFNSRTWIKEGQNEIFLISFFKFLPCMSFCYFVIYNYA